LKHGQDRCRETREDEAFEIRIGDQLTRIGFELRGYGGSGVKAGEVLPGRAQGFSYPDLPALESQRLITKDELLDAVWLNPSLRLPDSDRTRKDYKWPFEHIDL
jgi:hypothetical protein